jgi:hypothetical protein
MIVIGVDVHKQSSTAVAVDEAGRALAEMTVAAPYSSLASCLKRQQEMSVCRAFKPSDGLEPSSPLLTIERRGGRRVQAREAAGTKAAQEEGIARRGVIERAR